MRFLLFALVALLSLTVVSSAIPEWKSCATPSFDVTITNITSNVWPPEKGKDLILNITGTNSKAITSGDYIIAIKVDGIPIPNMDGDIDTFHPLPWPVGNLSFQYTQEIPASAPTGHYAIHISATDQDKNGIFCITLDTKIGLEDEVGTGKSGRGVLSSVLKGQARDVMGSMRKGMEKLKMKAMPAMPKLKRRL